MTPETADEYLCQRSFYWSSSRGKILIEDMHSSHAQAAANKMVREHPEWVGTPLHNALLVQAGDVEGDPTFDREGDEPF